MTKYIKSCLNYTGGKHKLLDQMIPLFPRNVHHFVDLFCGGANVAVNMTADGSIQCIDKQKEVIRLFHTLQQTDESEVLRTIEGIIEEYGLTNTSRYGYAVYGCESGSGLAPYNKEKYLKLRDDYNRRPEDNGYYDIVFYVLTVFGFNNQIRFSKKGHYNIPVGKRDFNERVRANLIDFMRAIKTKNIDFLCADFRDVKWHLGRGDFLYADPPYLITTATYNEQKGWTEKEEQDLLELLDRLHAKGVYFALSNVIEHKGAENAILKAWATKYRVHVLDFSYNNSNYQTKRNQGKTVEVLITNYE